MTARCPLSRAGPISSAPAGQARLGRSFPIRRSMLPLLGRISAKRRYRDA